MRLFTLLLVLVLTFCPGAPAGKDRIDGAAEFAEDAEEKQKWL